MAIARATPSLSRALNVAEIQGRNLAFAKLRVPRRLSKSGVKPNKEYGLTIRGCALTEELELEFGLLLFVLATAHRLEHAAVAEDIDR